MKNQAIKKYLLPTIGCLLLFTLISFFYFTPLLSGKAISQPDIIHYKGGAHELEEYRKTFGEETYWSNSMFGGMPTYQMGAGYPADVIKKIDIALSFFPSPASYIFLLMSGFFLLGMVWLKNWKYALLGSIMFAFSTYFFIIIGAGHNAKVHTIAYFAPFVAGVYLLYQRKYLWGFIVTTLFLSLQIAANHPQMTYYLFLALGIFGLVELISAIKDKQLKPFAISTAIFIVSILLSVGMNSSRLLSTYEYSQETIRGKSDLTLNKTQTKEGLDNDYITHWSYGKLETFNLFIPYFMGGGNNEKEFKTTHTETALQSNIKSEKEFNKFQSVFSGSYWGEQPGTSGPAYQGAVVIFLAILALFYYKGKYKWWLLGATIVSFVLSWGKNFSGLTDFMIDYFPMYNKFRAVSSILVIAEFTIPLLALLGVYAYFNDKSLDDKSKRKTLLITSGITCGILIIFYLFGMSLFDFHTEIEGKSISSAILEGVREDRFALFKSDTLRTLLFVICTTAFLYIADLKKYPAQYALFALSALALLDLWGVNKRYLNDENFVDQNFYKNPFPTEMNETLYYKAQENPVLMRIVGLAPMNKILNEIKEHDKSQYRVFNLTNSPFNETNTSYFHQSLGGYHGAKLRRYQDLIDYYLSNSENKKAWMEAINMMNTKYIVGGNPQDPQVFPNPDNNGNAWFVQSPIFVQNANEELESIGKINTKKQAVFNDKDKNALNVAPATDSTAVIALKTYEPNKLTYSANNKQEQLAVFSEIYYPKGWIASIDGKEVPIYRADYTLRALKVPAGQHTITFTFDPPVIHKGKTITIISLLIFILLTAGGLFYNYKKRTKIVE